MPMGERAFADSKGPRRKITLLISAEAYVLLQLAGALSGTSPTGQGVGGVEQWAENLLEREHERLSEAVAEERERRSMLGSGPVRSGVGD
jgi:hypothetical protein